MIKFFRKIRQKLLSENKFSKYLLYAIGEIILVVIGILIALQINNWNEANKTDENIKKYHINLTDNLNNDIELFQSLKESAIFRYYSSQYLVQLAGSPPYDPSKDEIVAPQWKENYIWDKPIPANYDSVFIEKAFLWTHRQIMPKSSLEATIEELKSTGNFSKLNNEIKEAINQYFIDCEFGFGGIAKEIISDLRLEWQRSLREDGINNSDPYMFGDPIKLLDGNPVRLAMLRKFAMESNWHAVRAEVVVTNAEKLIKLIEQESEN